MQQSCQGGLGGRWGRTGGQTPMESTTCAALAYNSHYVKCGRPVAARPGEDGGGVGAVNTPTTAHEGQGSP